MFFNKELRGFFGSMLDTKKQKRDAGAPLAGDVADDELDMDETLPYADIDDIPDVELLPQRFDFEPDLPADDEVVSCQSSPALVQESEQQGTDTVMNPLAEVFGFTVTDLSPKAQRYRLNRHCPFNNKVPNCTNDQIKNPLGVCSIVHNNKPVITCPVRFREDWLITDDAAAFFFKEGVRWSSLTEVLVPDAYGQVAGNIDVMLVAYDEQGRIIDFGALEVHAANISGNVRDPFEYYLKAPQSNATMDWTDQKNYPRPDFISAARESIVPQLLFKGGIFHSWHKKTAIAINKSFFDALPAMTTVNKEVADIAWLIYDLVPVTDGDTVSYQLRKTGVVYTEFNATLWSITAISPGNLYDFMRMIPELAG